MTLSETQTSQIAFARAAGFMFLFVDLADTVGISITGRFYAGTFAETAHQIVGAELLYRIGQSSLLVGSLATVLLAMGLYVAVKPIDKNLALLALLFRLVEATIFGVTNFIGFALLKIYTSVDLSNAFNAKQLSALLSLNSGGTKGPAFNIAGLFFSIGSILFFYLFVRSNYIPKFVSTLGLLGSVLVTITCFAYLIWPQPPGWLQFGWAPVAVGEILAGLWLLIKGLNFDTRESRA